MIMTIASAILNIVKVFEWALNTPNREYYVASKQPTFIYYSVILMKIGRR